MDDHVMILEDINLNNVTIHETTKQLMLDIDDISQKNTTEVTFHKWASPAFVALINALHEPEHLNEFNKYWYDAILIADEGLIGNQEIKLQQAEQSLQYIIEISNSDRATKLSNSFKNIARIYGEKTNRIKEQITNIAKIIKGLDSNISRIVQKYNITSKNMKTTSDFLEKCITDSNEIEQLWKYRILETIQEEYIKHSNELENIRKRDISLLKTNAIKSLPSIYSTAPIDTNLEVSPQLRTYQQACSDHCDAISLWNALLLVSCVSNALET